MVKYCVFSFWFQGTGKRFDRLSISNKSGSGKLFCWTKTESFLSLKLLGKELQAHCSKLCCFFLVFFPVVVLPWYWKQSLDSKIQEWLDYQALTSKNLAKNNWRRQESRLTNFKSLFFVARELVESILAFVELKWK